MLIFVSWSGDASKALATFLRGWLPDMLQGVEVWMSEEDIEKGTRWSAEIATKLATGYGLICVTRENQASQWLNFEAGALSKVTDESRVWAVVHDMPKTDVRAPLGQFNATDLRERNDVRRLIASMNGVGPKLADDVVRRQFDRMWPAFEDAVAKLPLSDATSAPAVVERSDTDMLAEILELLREKERSESAKRKLIVTKTPTRSDVDRRTAEAERLLSDIEMMEFNLETASMLPDEVRDLLLAHLANARKSLLSHENFRSLKELEHHVARVIMHANTVLESYIQGERPNLSSEDFEPG